MCNFKYNKQIHVNVYEKKINELWKKNIIMLNHRDVISLNSFQIKNEADINIFF